MICYLTIVKTNSGGAEEKERSLTSAARDIQSSAPLLLGSSAFTSSWYLSRESKRACRVATTSLMFGRLLGSYSQHYKNISFTNCKKKNKKTRKMNLH